MIKADLVIVLLIQAALSFRFAWRPSTKVFPYENFPETSIIDNGDNAGSFIEETVFYQDVFETVVDCIDVWIGNGACNRENNKESCNWDGGDCCRNSCKINCLEREQKGDPCKFDCGSFFGYECKQPDQGCDICGEHGICRS